MKRYYVTAAVIAALNIAIYPLMRHFAYLERGYHAHGGGEDVLLIAGFFAALMVIFHGQEKTGSRTQTNGGAPGIEKNPHIYDAPLLSTQKINEEA